MEYTFNEYSDMIWILGECRGNINECVRIYAERYPGRRHPNNGVIRRADQRLRETGSFANNQGADRGRQRYVRVPNLEEMIIDAIEEEPGASTRGIAREFNVSSSLVHRVLKEDGLNPYHKTRVQALNPADYPLRAEFCEWLLRVSIDNSNFISNIMWTDEATFTRDGVYNTHNNHVLARLNPQATHERAHQVRFGLNVWAGILNNQLIGPFILPQRLNAENYLEENLPELLENVPLIIRRDM